MVGIDHDLLEGDVYYTLVYTLLLQLETKSSEIAKLKEVLEAKETDSQKMQKRSEL